MLRVLSSATGHNFPSTFSTILIRSLCCTVVPAMFLSSLILYSFMLIQGNVAAFSRTFQFSSPASSDVLSGTLVSALVLYRQVAPHVVGSRGCFWGEGKGTFVLESFFFVRSSV